IVGPLEDVDGIARDPHRAVRSCARTGPQPWSFVSADRWRSPSAFCSTRAPITPAQTTAVTHLIVKRRLAPQRPRDPRASSINELLKTVTATTGRSCLERGWGWGCADHSPIGPPCWL